MTFPLHVSENKRYLVDSHGTPFFLSGDSPWEISWQLTIDEAELLPRGPPPAGVQRHPRRCHPLHGLVGPLHADEPQRACALAHAGGLLDPQRRLFRRPGAPGGLGRHEGYARAALRGGPGGDQRQPSAMERARRMWHAQYLANDPHTMGAYARYLGERFRAHPNIVWMVGGDRNPYGVFWHIDEMARPARGHPRPPHHLSRRAKSSGLFFQEQPGATSLYPTATTSRTSSWPRTTGGSPSSRPSWARAGTREKPVAGSPFTNSGSHAMTPPETNAAGDSDVVLVLYITRP